MGDVCIFFLNVHWCSSCSIVNNINRGMFVPESLFGLYDSYFDLQESEYDFCKSKYGFENCLYVLLFMPFRRD